jgi:1,4-alpha-glucan branching enzyme
MLRRRKPVCFASWLVLTAAYAHDFPPQSSNLLPRRADEGVLFECYAPNAKTVYLAGDFNDWAHNQDGRIADAQFAMQGPEANGVWRKVIKLDPGTHRFKFNLNGQPDLWFVPTDVEELDESSNGVFRVTNTGNVVLRSGRNPIWKPQQSDNGVVFQLYAPDAHMVCLAGDFNNWADNRDGLVFNPKFAMQAPHTSAVWRVEIKLPPGRHLYQFVVDGDRWIADPNAVETDRENHSVLVVQ